MPKQTYHPTESDRLTGSNVRALRRLAGETLAQTLERSGLELGQSSLSRVELGERPLSMPEATKLAAHFNTTPQHIIVSKWEADQIMAPTLNTTVSPAVATEQEWLGNDKPKPPMPTLGTLFAVVDDMNSQTLTIDRRNPLTPDEYREQVWIPYLETRYNADMKAS